MHGLLTLGDVLAPETLSLPANVAAHAFTPHAAVLPRASLVVTHAGLWTVMAEAAGRLQRTLACAAGAAGAADELERLCAR